MRSRGSNWPRFSNFGLASLALSSTFCSTSRKLATAASMASRLAAKAASWTSISDWITGMFLFSVLQYIGLVGTVKTVVGLAVLGLAQGPGTGALAGGAVDADGVAADEAGAGGEQEDDGRGDFRFGGDALQRYMVLEGTDHVLHGVRVGVHAAGRHPARCHGVDAHASVAPFVGSGLGEVFHAGTGRAGVPHARHAAPHVSEHVDDAAAVL